MYLSLNAVSKFKTPVWWCTKIPGGSLTGMKFGLRKRQWGSGAVVVTGNFGSDASGCTVKLWHFLCKCAVVFPWKSRADDCDVIKWHHSNHSCYWRREVYKESELKPQGCHLGFWYWTVVSIVKSLILYFSYISAYHGARVYPGWPVYHVYSCACTQDFLGTL